MIIFDIVVSRFTGKSEGAVGSNPAAPTNFLAEGANPRLRLSSGLYPHIHHEQL